MQIVELASVGWHEHVAHALVSTIRQALASQERFHLVLSGGTTPRALYAYLATPEMQKGVAWERVHLWWGDERYVPPTDSRSNFRMAYEAWLAHGAVPRENWHPMPTDCAEPEACAQRYEAELRQIWGDALPAFDLTLLGLGEDGHTASLFPGNSALHETKRWVAVGHAPTEPRIRLTLTFPVLNASQRVWFLVAGESKRPVLERVWQGDPALPASRIQPVGELRWWVIR